MEIIYLGGHDIRIPFVNNFDDFILHCRNFEGNELSSLFTNDFKNIILHCCNDIGVMGSGVARSLFLKWPEVRNHYFDAFKKKENHNLGEFHLVEVDDNTYVANIIGQHNISENEDGGPPVRYWAIDKAFSNIAKLIKSKKENCVINIPYLMGCDLARGRWEEIEYLINKNFIDNNIPVYVYDLYLKKH